MARRKLQDEEKLTEQSEAVRCRVLVACRFGAVNDIAEVDSEELDAAKELGLVDDHPDAVEYAETLPQNASQE